MEICSCVADLIFSLIVQSHCGCMSSANAAHTSPPLQLGSKDCQSPSACSPCRAWHFILLCCFHMGPCLGYCGTLPWLLWVCPLITPHFWRVCLSSSPWTVLQVSPVAEPYLATSERSHLPAPCTWMLSLFLIVWFDLEECFMKKLIPVSSQKEVQN